MTLPDSPYVRYGDVGNSHSGYSDLNHGCSMTTFMTDEQLAAEQFADAYQVGHGVPLTVKNFRIAERTKNGLPENDMKLLEMFLSDSVYDAIKKNPESKMARRYKVRVALTRASMMNQDKKRRIREKNLTK